jgi:carboxypeptidase PM20D1
MKRSLVLLGVPLLLVAGVAFVRTARDGAARGAAPLAPRVERMTRVALPRRAAERLAGAIMIATISHADPADFDAGAFRSLRAYLARSFPRAHAALERETVAEHSLLCTWRGSDPSLKPILLAGHLDAVRFYHLLELNAAGG